MGICLSLSLSLSPISKHPFLFLLFVSVLYHLNPSPLFILGMPESPMKGRPKRILLWRDKVLQEAKPGQPPGLQQAPDVRRCRPDQSLSSEPRPTAPADTPHGAGTAGPGNSRDKDWSSSCWKRMDGSSLGTFSCWRSFLCSFSPLPAVSRASLLWSGWSQIGGGTWTQTPSLQADLHQRRGSCYWGLQLHAGIGEMVARWPESKKATKLNCCSEWSVFVYLAHWKQTVFNLFMFFMWILWVVCLSLGKCNISPGK